MVTILVTALVLCGSDFGLDWSAGVVRVPAFVVIDDSGNRVTLPPSDADIRRTVWESLRNVFIEKDKAVSYFFANEMEFNEVVMAIRFKLGDGCVEVSLWGQGGIIYRIQHASAYLRGRAQGRGAIPGRQSTAGTQISRPPLDTEPGGYSPIQNTRLPATATATDTPQNEGGSVIRSETEEETLTSNSLQSVFP